MKYLGFLSDEGKAEIMCLDEISHHSDQSLEPIRGWKLIKGFHRLADADSWSSSFNNPTPSEGNKS